MRRTCFTGALAIATALAALPAFAQTATPNADATPSAPAAQPPAPAPAVAGTPAAPAARPAAVPPPNVSGGIATPADYVIGVDDSLEIVYWQDKDMSAAVTVRPDGNISLPLVNDIRAAGLTPEQLRAEISKAASKFIEDPTVSIVVKAINSRKVFLTGQVAKPGPYPLLDETTVLQMLATAGGTSEYAKTDKVTIIRRENGKDVVHRFNYNEVAEGKNLNQNIVLKPGDTIIVP